MVVNMNIVARIKFSSKLKDWCFKTPNAPYSVLQGGNQPHKLHIWFSSTQKSRPEKTKRAILCQRYEKKLVTFSNEKRKKN